MVSTLSPHSPTYHSTAPTSYDTALQLAKTQAEACILLLNRSHARLQHHAYDAALADAKAALKLPSGRKHPSTENEKGLFRAARALYGLRRFRESCVYLKVLRERYPGNRIVKGEVERCEMRLREEKGEIDFVDILKEATEKYPSPDMDRADFVVAIEVRVCANPDHGRGMFTTRAVKAGELLLCEKAFSAAFARGEGDEASKKDADEDDEGVASTGDATGLTGKRHDLDDPKTKEMMRQRAELATKTFVKLHRNPSLQKGFMDLYPGPDADKEIDEETGAIEVDELVLPAYEPLTSDEAASLMSAGTTEDIYVPHNCYSLISHGDITTTNQS